jgi:hypothetical protein
MDIKMKVKLLTCLLVLVSFGYNAMAQNNESLENNKTLSGSVTKKIENSNNLYIEKTGTYSIKEGDCSVMWGVEMARKEGQKKLTLSVRYPVGIKCRDTFAEQLPLHRQVLGEIFKDWNKDQFRMLFLQPFERAEPDHTWNIRIAMASANSSDWEDWSRNYPKHRSGKSSNEIFVEIANQVNAYKELAVLFEEFGLEIKLDSVEKVFAQKARELPFYQELKSQGLEGNPSLIYDAGMNYFSISVSE